MSLPLEQAVQQLTDELAQARAQIVRISGEMSTMRAQAAQAIADSEARMAAEVARVSGGGGGGAKDDELKMVDFKVSKPSDFYGRREESWKAWSRQFKTYCNAIKSGIRKALDWAESFDGKRSTRTRSIQWAGLRRDLQMKSCTTS